jgi:exodeoxyribonuclease V beta subunit
MTIPPMDVRHTPVEGTLLVEASAGTGKTWTIGALLLRLLMEGRPLPGILILTFTEAATADLRSRMRHRLEEALDGLDQVPGVRPDELLASLVERGALREDQARHLLRHALAQFDEASIFTIHGFCRRVLREAGLGAGLSGNPELGEGAREALERVALDQLRRWWADLPHSFLDWLGGQSVGHGRVKSRLLEPAAWVELAGGAGEGMDPVQEQTGGDQARDELRRLDQERERCRAACLAEVRRQGIPALVAVLSTLDLKGNIYKLDNQAALLAVVERWLETGSAAQGFPKTSDKGQWYFTTSHLRNSQKKGATTQPSNPLFDRLEELEAAQRGLVDLFPRLLRVLQEEAAASWPGRAAALRLDERRLDFHDLLLLVHNALKGPGAPALKELLRARWQLAMLDEFQDTDPLQSEIFRLVFREAGLPLVLVGDPKQAIYGFRGADLDAYLQVARTADQQRSLGMNWRSDPPLVRAVNLLFGGGRFPDGRGAFLHPEVRFQPVEACPKPDDRAVHVNGRELPAFLVVQSASPGLNKARATAIVCRHLARLVEQLLDPRQSGWRRRSGAESLGGIQGRELAILVRTARQAGEVAQALAGRGIASIQGGRDSVWDSDEAELLVRLLQAMERPDDSGRAKALLAGGLAEALGGDALSSLQDPPLLARVQRELHQARAAGARMPLSTAVELLLDSTHWRAAMLARPLGERRVVNWTHLLELLRGEERRMPLDPGAMARRVQAKRHEPLTAEWEQRLESEDNLVRIVTMHKSKGLEYPLVLCPFLWEGVGPGRDFGLERLPARPDGQPGRRALVTPGLELEAELQGELADARLAEALRLAYVALTRARSQVVCYSLSTTWQKRNPSPLDWLLFPGLVADLPHPGLGKAWKDLAASSGDQWEVWRELADAEDGLGVEELETAWPAAAGATDPEPAVPQLPPCRVFHGRLEPREATSSFTSLLRGSHADERQDEWFGPEEGEAEDLLEESAPAPGGRDGWAQIPAGAAAGVCLHSLLEKGLAEGGVTEAACRMELLAAGLDVEHAPFLAPRLDGLLRRPLGAQGPVPLQVDPGSRATELAFHLSTSGLAEGRLREICRRHGLHDPRRLGVGEPATVQALELATRRDPRALAEGFLKGYMDLCLCWRERWWVLDWKSNRLARDAAGYTRERMVRSMAESGYFLQALIYLTALHRHLNRVEAGYDPARRLGGLRYVYLRGLCDGDEDSGVLTDRLPVELILDLDAALGRST